MSCTDEVFGKGRVPRVLWLPVPCAVVRISGAGYDVKPGLDNREDWPRCRFHRRHTAPGAGLAPRGAGPLGGCAVPVLP